MEKHFLKPGELYFSFEGTIIDTILGSCVAVCVFDKHLKIGGMSHFLLPEPPISQAGGKYNYAIYALPALLKEFKEAGSQKEYLSIKLIGGGRVIDTNSNNLGDIGNLNIRKARELIRKYGFRVEKEDTGGDNGRKVQFNTQTGEIKIKKIERERTTSNILLEKKEINVMIIDDSKPVRMVLKKMLETNPKFKVIAEASNPIEAMEIRKKSIRPDVITLDLNMPQMDGVTYLKQFMKVDPIPTIVVTDYNLSDSGPVFEALDAGAFDYIKKPSLNEMEKVNEDLHTLLIEASKSNASLKKKSSGLIIINTIKVPEILLNSHLIAIGASTGGTEALKELFLGLPANIPPMVVVQHMPPVFTKAFAERLNSLSKFKVKEAENNEIIGKGTAYIAPGGLQMKLLQDSDKIRIKITDDPPINRFKPSVDYMFDSVAGIKNKSIVGVIMTGMGGDGAKGLLRLKNMGAKTIAQNESSCVVFGMPKVAIELGAAMFIEKLDEIPQKMIQILNSTV